MGVVYLDGGITDNHPYRPLADAGFTDIILIHLEPTSKWKSGSDVGHIYLNASEPVQEGTYGCRVYHVVPSKGIGKTLEVSHGLTEYRMELGYRDAQNQLPRDFLQKLMEKA